jgi:predicted RNase H-like HicB family nuclease
MCRCDDHGVEVPLFLEELPDGGFVVRSPILPELAAQGKTREDALKTAEADIAALLNRYEEQGKPLPPQFR